MRYRLHTFFGVLILLSIFVGWSILRWQRNQEVEHNLQLVKLVKNAVLSYEPKIHELILADPDFAEQFAQSPAPANQIAGGRSHMSDSLSVMSNRRSSFNVGYHYYWPDKTGGYSPKTEVQIKLDCEYYEQALERPVVNLFYNSSEISDQVLELIESDLRQFNIEVIKSKID